MFIVINDVQRWLGLDALQESLTAGERDGKAANERVEREVKQVMKEAKLNGKVEPCDI